MQQQPTLEQRIAFLEHQHAQAQRTYQNAQADMYRIEGQIFALRGVLEEQKLEEEQYRQKAMMQAEDEARQREVDRIMKEHRQQEEQIAQMEAAKVESNGHTVEEEVIVS